MILLRGDRLTTDDDWACAVEIRILSE
jgi:hypothetical protein